LLREAGARPGVIFGRLSDRQAYAMILERNMTLLLSLVMELAEELRREQPIMIVIDAAETYNPVHDLSRLIAGAAIEMANVDTKQYEYAVVNSPYSFDSAHDDVIAFDLDDAAHAAKIEQARLLASLIPGHSLVEMGGVQRYERDLALWLLRRGHSPVVYGTELGVAARELTRLTIPVTDDLRTIAAPIDVIHGDSPVETMAALLHFPD